MADQYREPSSVPIPLSYAPWVPREVQGGMYRQLVAVWGDPNTAKWPQATLEAVCERGASKPMTYDWHASANATYYLADRPAGPLSRPA